MNKKDNTAVGGFYASTLSPNHQQIINLFNFALNPRYGLKKVTPWLLRKLPSVEHFFLILPFNLHTTLLNNLG